LRKEEPLTRLVTFRRDGDRINRLGVLLERGQTLDLREKALRSDRSLPFDPGDMISLIEAAPASVDVTRELAKAADRTPVPLASVRVVAPIPRNV
jgi:hypothetical protein